MPQVYTRSAARTIDGTDQDQAIFETLQAQAKYGLKLKQASRYAKLVKTIFVKVTYRNGTTQLDILTRTLWMWKRAKPRMIF